MPENPKLYQHHQQQREQNYWWKISMAHHTMQFVFGPRLAKGCQPLF